MPAPDPAELVRLASSLTQTLGCRAVMCAGWSGLEQVVADTPKDLLILKEAPHDYLFPRHVSWTEVLVHCALACTLCMCVRLPTTGRSFASDLYRCGAIVHHCGVGTTAAALRAGVPQVPCWVMLDQPHNATRVHDMGCATEPLPFHKMTLEVWPLHFLFGQRAHPRS